MSLASQLHDQPETAFDTTPVERVGASLNYSPSITRDDVLMGLGETDAKFANLVRKAIFTFKDIPDRVDPVDLPKMTKEVEQAVLVTALVSASSGDQAPVAEFILENISKRMAEAIREEMADLGKVKAKDGEEAMTEVINAIRTLEANGEITLIIPDEDEDGE